MPSTFNSTLQLFGPACLVYLLSDVRPTVELGDSLNQEGVFNPFLRDLNNSPESKYLDAFGPKKLQSRANCKKLIRLFFSVQRESGRSC